MANVKRCADERKAASRPVSEHDDASDLAQADFTHIEQPTNCSVNASVCSVNATICPSTQNNQGFVA